MAPPRKVEERPSSPSALADRVRAVGRAWRAGDEAETRAELRALSDEARFLSQTVAPLIVSEVRSRQDDYLGKRHGTSSTA